MVGVSTATLYRWFVKLGIPFRDNKERLRIRSKKMMGHTTSAETKLKIGQSQLGDKGSNWHGGWTMVDGYKKIMVKDHPFADGDGYVLEHRLLAEKAIGRYLEPKYPVHHINGVRDDNRNDNLVICDSQSYHQFLHRRMQRLVRNI